MASRSRLGRSVKGRGEELIRGWEASGLTQREYCERRGVPLTTFAYHRRRQLKGELPHGEECGREAPVPPLTLLPVRVVETSSGEAAWGFVLTLRNGRRIEAGWGFVDSELARLVRVAERE